MRQSLEKEVEGLRAALEREGREHSQLLTRYLSEVENRTQAQVGLWAHLLPARLPRGHWLRLAQHRQRAGQVCNSEPSWGMWR